MSRLFRKYLLKYEFLQLELEDTAEFVDTKTQDWNKLFGKYQPKEREVWINEETGEVNSVPESKQKDKPITLPEVKKLYRNLSKHIHPDKGGSQEDFNRLKKYYDTNNIFGLIEEAGKFSIEFDVSELSEEALEIACKGLQKEISEKRNTVLWKYFKGDTKDKLEVISQIEGMYGVQVDKEELDLI